VAINDALPIKAAWRDAIFWRPQISAADKPNAVSLDSLQA